MFNKGDVQIASLIPIEIETTAVITNSKKVFAFFKLTVTTSAISPKEYDLQFNYFIY